MNSKTTAQISVGSQITGYTISIDRTDITLSNEEAILLTHLLLQKGTGLNLADLVTPEAKERIVSIISKATNN